MNHPALPARSPAPGGSARGAPPSRWAFAALPGAFLPAEGRGSADKRVPPFRGSLGLAAQISGQRYFPLPFCGVTGELMALPLARQRILPSLQYNKGQ